MSVRTTPGTARGVARKTALGVARGTALGHPALERRGSALLAMNDGRQGHLSRPAALRRRGFPGPASIGTEILPTSHKTPVPTPAHPTPRAIRVLRSPR